MLKSGLLQQANGGYIIFQAEDLLSNGICYEALKKALRVKEVTIENAQDQRSSNGYGIFKTRAYSIRFKGYTYWK